MRLQRLRLAGFKSFVDPTEFTIEPGLTGVVGPNGCGKSNLLEALRWAMGANSARAMRAGGMDDLIFAGGGRRPPRDWAEVTLTIGNTDGRWRAGSEAGATLQVSRRIDRGQGSTYRIDGREVRARDIQLLFADASTGANSPALVRQGQISELIAAKPENRRRVLEEAGGVSGLHGRRHEAELRLRAAEANLDRLDDVAREIETTLGRLRREARAAERYKRLAAEIRILQVALLHARWSEADLLLQAAEAEAARLSAQVQAATRDAAIAATVSLDAEAALPALREAHTVAAAVLQRVTLECDRLQASESQARAEASRLKLEQTRLRVDREREEKIAEDAGRQLERLERLLTQAEADLAGAPERLPALKVAAESAEAARAEADAEVERLASSLAAAEARQLAEAQHRQSVEARASRAQRALNQAQADLTAAAASGGGEGPEPTSLAEAEAELTRARVAVQQAEAAGHSAGEVEVDRRDAARSLSDRRDRLLSEARGLAQLLTASAAGEGKPVLNGIDVDAGFEAALAAAFGNDLQASLDPASASFWAGAEPVPVAWPAGVIALSDHVRAPPELAATLAAVGVCGRDAGSALQTSLPPGARLVSRAGDLWRWDGYVARADAPRPAAVRLSQKARLQELEAELDHLAPNLRAAETAYEAAGSAVRERQRALAEARRQTLVAEQALRTASEAARAHARRTDQRNARVQALDETVATFAAELSEASAALAQLPPGGDGSEAQDQAVLSTARSRAAEARKAAAAARTSLDVEVRDAQGRVRRIDALRRDRQDWLGRQSEASRRIAGLEREAERAGAALQGLQDAPERLAAERQRLDDALETARHRAIKAADALALAETARASTARAGREADAAAAAAREARAAAAARAEDAARRHDEVAAEIRQATGDEPAELARRMTEAAIALPPSAAGMETHLAALERQREQLGGVNLLAVTEAEEQASRLETLNADRADLAGAIARLRDGVAQLNSEGRDRLVAAFDAIQGHFQSLFHTLFDGGQAELRLVENDDPLEAGLEVYACPPGKRLSAMSLMSGGEQALTAIALIFAVFLANPAPICVLDEVDAPLDDANVDRFCKLLEEMTRRTATPFLVITHNSVTMSRMDRLYGVTMPERGVSQLVSVDLRGAERMAAE